MLSFVRVKLEREVGVPAVIVADDVAIPDELWLRRFAHGPFETSLLHFRDRNIVNRFNTPWGKAAALQATELLNESPLHRDKYLWFLAVHQAAAAGQELVPPSTLARFLSEGAIGRRPQR
jgi:hypothetical protein